MTLTKTSHLVGGIMALLLAAMLALFLAGCGGQSSSSSSASETESSSEATEVAIPNDVAAISDVVKGVAESGDATGADEIDKLPTAEAAEGESLEASEIEVGTDDSSKYSGDVALVQLGGIQMVVPTSWRAGNQPDGYVFANPAGDVICIVSAYAKASGETLPLEDLARAIPSKLASSGLSDVTVMNYGTDYSATGTLCTSFVYCSGTLNGTEYLVYDQIVDSKNYANLVEIMAPANAFKANFDEISTMTKSLYFKPGEEI